MEKTTDEEAKKAAKTLIRYCLETGCLYCQYVELDGQDIDCSVRRPREWRIEDNEKDEER